MRKKSIKKMLTVLIVVAMVFTNSGFKTVSAENTLVDFIYPNTRKLTMITDTEAKLNVDVIPRDASNQKVTFTSSNEDVAKVSSDGVVTAVSSGKTKITVKAADGGGAKETVNVTVLKNLVIDDSFVDPENDVIVIDKTYGHVTVDGSVGDADVYLAGLKIRGDLTLEAGEYNIETYDTSIENLIFAAPLEEEAEIESFSVTEDEEVDESYPSLIVGRNSKISNVNVSASALIKQAEETKIDKITFTQDKEGKITLYLDGYSGDLLLNSYLGDIEIVISNSTLGKVEVDGLEDSGNVKFTDLDGTSSLETLELKGAAKVEVQLPADEITIDRNASGASLVVGGITGTLNNAGKDSDIKIIGSVDNLETTGENTKVEVAKDALVLSINIDGKGSSLSGAGQVAEAYVNADDVNVDINNALVVIGDVTGVKVYGVEQASGSSTTSQAPVVYVPVPVEPETVTRFVDFEDDEVGTSYKMIGWDVAGSSAKVVEMEDGNKALEISPSNYNTAAVVRITLPDGKKLGDYSAITYKALWKQGDVSWKDVVVEAGESLSGQFFNDVNEEIGSYNRSSGPTTELAEERITLNDNLSDLTGTIEIAIGINCEGESDGLATVYYLDDISLVPKETSEDPVDPVEPVDPIEPGEKLLFSADFEDGQDPFVNGYEAERAPEGPWHNGGIEAVSGGAILIETEGEDYKGIGYSFTNTEPKTYRIEAKVKNAVDETGKTVRLQMLPSYGTIDEKNFEISYDNWTDINYTFTLDAPSCVIIAPSWSGSGTSAYSYYVDDFKVYEVLSEDPGDEAPEEPDEEAPVDEGITPIVILIDFEDENPFDNYKGKGKLGHTGGGERAVTGSAISLQGFESEKSLQITATGDWHGISYWIDNQESVPVTYTISAQVKLVSGLDAVRFQTQDGAPEEELQYINEEFKISEDEWTLVSVSIEVPVGGSVCVELKPTTNDEMVFLVDDFSVTNQ